MIYFISDTHFDHENIISFCRRPFVDVESMNNVLVADWNRTVKLKDTVYFLGDLTFGRGRRPHRYWLDQLNGNITFIKGSHDDGCLDSVCLPIYDNLLIRLNDSKLLLIHDPDDVPSDYTGWVMHGHHHNNHPTEYPLVCFNRKTINVSVELIGYKPISSTRIIQLMEMQSDVPRLGRNNEIIMRYSNQYGTFKAEQKGMVIWKTQKS